MKKYKSASEGYAVSSQIKKILFKEGYVALRIIPENSEKINLCETTKIKENTLLPQGADTVIKPEMLTDYGSLVLIEEDFASLNNVIEA
jgi:molybdopterin biosynthesis enzyme